MTTEAVAGRATLSLHVNGRAREVEAYPSETILRVLREHLGLNSVREGCGIGMCGACTILVDRKPISSCLALAASAVGREILTLEALSDIDTLHPVQQAYLECSAFQCSYCTPGFIMATLGLLDENGRPDRAEAREYLAGNLCRCGSYLEILDAVALAAERLAGESAVAPGPHGQIAPATVDPIGQ